MTTSTTTPIPCIGLTPAEVQTITLRMFGPPKQELTPGELHDLAHKKPWGIQKKRGPYKPKPPGWVAKRRMGRVEKEGAK